MKTQTQTLAPVRKIVGILFVALLTLPVLVYAVSFAFNGSATPELQRAYDSQLIATKASIIALCDLEIALSKSKLVDEYQSPTPNQAEIDRLTEKVKSKSCSFTQ